MKISKKTLIYLGIGVYVIVTAAVGFIMFEKMDEEDAVSEELTSIQTNLDKLNPARLDDRKLELENQLSQVSSQTDTLKNMMSQEIANVAASTIVFDIADTTGVDIVWLSSPSASPQVLENVPCTVVSLEATVDGSVSDLVDFITRLNNYLATGVIKSVDMNIPETSSNTSPTVSISLLIYNYQGE